VGFFEIKVIFADGAPPRFEREESLLRAEAEARRLMADEAIRTAAGFRHEAARNLNAQNRQQTWQWPSQPAGDSSAPSHFIQQGDKLIPVFSSTPSPSRRIPESQFTASSRQKELLRERATGLRFGPDPGRPGFPTYPQPNPHQFCPPHSNKTAEELEADSIRQKYPQLRGLPDSYILRQTVDSLLKLEDSKSEGHKSSKNLAERHHQNYLKAIENPTYSEGFDNRGDIFDPARVRPGSSVSLQRHWLEGRKEWGPDGVDAIEGYDTDSLGCAGAITSRGWEALHHPGSGEMSIKLFSVSNVGHSATGSRTVSLTGEDGFVIHESWKELNDMAEFKQALRNIVTCAHVVSWWNFSYKVLEVFLHNNDYFEKELASYKKVQVLTSFCDYVFKKNSDNYIREAEFLDLQKLQVTWSSWWSARKAGLRSTASDQNHHHQSSSQKPQFQNKKQEFKKPRQDLRTIPFITKTPTESSICRRFSVGTCKNEHYGCSIETNAGRRRLFHLCAAEKVDSSGNKSTCLERHSKKDHK